MDTGNPNQQGPIHFLQPTTAPKPARGEELPPEQGVMFYSNTPGSTFIYTDGTMEVFKHSGNLITDTEKIRQLRAASDRSAGLIHTRVPTVEVLVKPDKLAEARAAILGNPANAAAAATDKRIQELLEKAKAQQQAPLQVPPLGATNSVDVAKAAAGSNSGTASTVK